MVVLRGECKNVGKWICETDLFETYITEHLAKYAGIWKVSNRPTTLFLYDEHNLHISLTFTQ